MDITIYHNPACGNAPGRDTIRALARATDEPLRWTFFPR
jgi:hypothetical protein